MSAAFLWFCCATYLPVCRHTVYFILTAWPANLPCPSSLLTPTTCHLYCQPRYGNTTITPVSEKTTLAYALCALIQLYAFTMYSCEQILLLHSVVFRPAAGDCHLYRSTVSGNTLALITARYYALLSYSCGFAVFISCAFAIPVGIYSPILHCCGLPFNRGPILFSGSCVAVSHLPGIPFCELLRLPCRCGRRYERATNLHLYCTALVWIGVDILRSALALAHISAAPHDLPLRSKPFLLKRTDQV